MKRVQFAEVIRGAIAERGEVESGEVFFLLKLPEDLRRCTVNCAAALSTWAYWANLLPPLLMSIVRNCLAHSYTSPNKVAVNLLQVREIEVPFERRLRKLPGAGRNEISFGLFERGRVNDAEAIFQDAG
jgi:hypothetical protein